MRGRKPKPIERQISEGDPRKHGTNKFQDLLGAQVQARHGLPACPRHLRGEARRAWNFWSRELADMDLDRRPDAMALEATCIAYQVMIEAYATITKCGHEILEPVLNAAGEVVGNRIKSHPAIARLHSSMLRLRAFCSEFGVTPASRVRLTVERRDDLPDLMELLSQPRKPRVE